MPIFYWCKRNPHHRPSTTVLDSWYEVFVLIYCRWFSSNMLLCIMDKYIQFVPVCPNNVYPEVLWLVQMELCKPKQCCHILLKAKAFLQQLLQTSQICSVFFIIVLSWTLIFIMLTEACRVEDIALEISSLSLSIAWSNLGLNLLNVLSWEGEILSKFSVHSFLPWHCVDTMVLICMHAEVPQNWKQEKLALTLATCNERSQHGLKYFSGDLEQLKSS